MSYSKISVVIPVRNEVEKLITVIGLGYVGLALAVGFALKGYNVTGIDRDNGNVECIGKKSCPIYEVKLAEALKKVNIITTTSYESIQNSDITFICVGTPCDSDGKINLDQIEQSAMTLGKELSRKNGYHLVVIKSTVVPETTQKKIIPILEEYSNKVIGEDVGICVSPEFLREGRVLEDFMSPSRIIIGESDRRAGDVLCALYSDFKAPMVRTDLKTAEMIKYAGNAFLATKVSFINEIGNICKRLGIDAYDVARGIGYDSRIGNKYLDAGIGFGGSCLPKDLKALVAKAQELDYEATMLKSVMEVNRRQPLHLVNILEKRIGKLNGKRIAILGLAFKQDTDDVRDSQAIPVVKELSKMGAQVVAYDPKAMGNMKKIIGGVEYKENAKNALKGADACLVLTDWDEFRRLDKEFEVMSKKVIIEGRRVTKESVEHEGICW